MPRKAKPASSPPPLASPSQRTELRRWPGPWFQMYGRDLPWRRTRDPYAILVSELMLQQTQVATVKPYFERWLARFPDFPTLAAAEESAVLHAWQGLGYYARARHLHRAARHVVEHHAGALPDDAAAPAAPPPPGPGGRVGGHHAGALPDDAAAIAALPGVGRYTQGAIASFAFD